MPIGTLVSYEGRTWVVFGTFDVDGVTWLELEARPGGDNISLPVTAVTPL